MSALPILQVSNQPTGMRLFPVILILLLSSAVFPQGSGRESSGTGGKHVITGKIFFPSGRRAEGSIQVKLQNYSVAEISTMADSNGAFTFSALSPGNYTIVVIAGDDYEIAREGVTVDSDLNLSRAGISLSPGMRRYTVMITLRPKREVQNRTKASVINAALAEVPAAARTLYQQAIESAKTGDSAKAIDSLKMAISLYPKFPLALNELGVQYLRLGQATKAVEPLKSASKLSPDAYSPHLNLGIALLETRQLPEAEAELREAIKINASPTAQMYLGLTLVTARRFDEAQQALETAISSGGETLALAHRYLGGIYWRKHDYRRAIDEFESYLRLTPNAPDAEQVRGTIKELRAKS
ncbi:MAG: tetratricopeptide repeat protein [Pyrinomonadaceae bacterium]